MHVEDGQRRSNLDHVHVETPCGIFVENRTREIKGAFLAVFNQVEATYLDRITYLVHRREVVTDSLQTTYGF